MDDLYNLALGKLGDLSREVHIEEYSQFDALTGVRICGFARGEILTKNVDQISWRRALGTIDVRIGSRTHVESEPLRHWKGVIERAYADFQANLPSYEPCQHASLVLASDGRTADSTAPNYLRPEERQPYGL